MRKNRKRTIPQLFYISSAEKDFLEKKMAEAGIQNKSAYLRKMALDGYIIRQDYGVLKGVAHDLSRIGNNLNQMAKIANTYHDVNHSELQAIDEALSGIWQLLLSLEVDPIEGKARCYRRPRKA